MRSLLVCGTTSDAGKTIVVAGLCRALARRGVKVAPFKAQNMSLNSYVTRAGEEIGRAQAAQAQAAGVEPEAAMNPVLLKPGSDTTSQVIVMGHAVGERDASAYWGPTAEGDQARLLDVVVDAHRDLSSRFDVVICEGAGSPAEINLRRSDIVNMGFARAAGVPVIVVGDIDRGGVFASFAGTVGLLDAEDQALVAGFVVNKFRGDESLLTPGIDMLAELTGRPTFGVLPFVEGIGLDAEDAIDQALLLSGSPPLGDDVLRVNVVAFPRMSNHTDIDALALEPGVVVRFVREPAQLADADLVVLPGTRATVSDLAWMRARGLDVAVERHAAAGRPVLGICGGYQMLGSSIIDDVESRSGSPGLPSGRVRGLGLLPVRTVFGRGKVLARPSVLIDDPDAGPVRVEGYEIHHGIVERDGGVPVIGEGDSAEGCVAGSVTGTVWHGLLENDVVRRRFLAGVATACGRRFVAAPDVSFAAEREARLDRLGDLVANHLDVDALLRLMEGGGPTPPTLRFTRSG
jgi:adenosylcobyric acid synthase